MEEEELRRPREAWTRFQWWTIILAALGVFTSAVAMVAQFATQ
ncbi:hypothetical protein [Streptomyces smyrnaeus]